MLAVIFAVSIVIVDPRGEMPLDDDWNFAMATWHFHETGEFRFSRLTGMSLRGQVVWGALWTELFGRSHEVLRASTLFLAAATILLFFELLVRIGVESKRAFFLTLVLLFSPMFFWSAFTYMTHVPYLFLSVASFYFAVRGVGEKRLMLVVAAGVIALASCLIRQTGLANMVPAVVGIALAWRSLPRKGWWVTTAAAPFVAFGVLFAGTNLLQGYPGQINEHLHIWRGGLLSDLAAMAEIAHRYISFNFEFAFLFFLPVMLPIALVTLRTRLGRISTLAVLPVTLLSAGIQIALMQPLPYPTRGNVFSNLALGPLTLRDTFIWSMNYVTSLGLASRIVLTLFAAAGAAVLLAFVVTSAARALASQAPAEEEATTAGAGSGARMPVLMGLSHVVVATVLLFASGIYFDRYSIDSTWGLLVAAGFIPISARVRWVNVSILVLVAVLSVAGTAEYLAWNRARWDAYRFLRARGVTLQQMDAGYEVNQYLLGGWDGHLELASRGMSVVDDQFMLTFNPLYRCRVLAKFPYRRLLGRDGHVYALEQEPGFHVWDAVQQQTE